MNSPPGGKSGNESGARSSPGRHRRRRWVVLAVLSVLVFHVPLLRWFGHLLTVNEPLGQCDAVVILSGDHRYDVVADLFHHDRIDHVWLVRDEPDYLEVSGILPPPLDVATDQLTGAGIPSQRLERLDGIAAQLTATARIVASQLKENPETEVLLVCSALDGRRVRLTFNDVLGESLARRVHVLGLPYDDFEVEKWWHSRTGLKHVFSQLCLMGFELVVGEQAEVGEMPDPDAWEAQLQVELAGVPCRED